MPRPSTSIELPWPDVPARHAAAFVAGASESAWLDSSNAADGCSLVARDPSFTIDQTRGEPAKLIDCTTLRAIDDDRSFWNLLTRAVTSTHNPDRAQSPRGFGPGWMGYCGFELADELERLPAAKPDSLEMPLGRWSYYPGIVELDHASERARIVAATPKDAERTREQWATAIQADSRPARKHAARQPPRWRESVDAATFRAWVERARAYIAAGDIYQVNLAHALRLDRLPPAMELFEALRRENPAPYAALLHWSDVSVVSVSPELFIEKRGVRVRTCPIKGTRPRGGDGGAADDPAVRELIRSEKEAAELAMIVDLHRNDLGRACKPGSVRVVDPRRVEAHPHIWHTVAEIAGEVQDDVTAVELLRRMFPAGSVSGVPKVRALQIIREIETSPRGVYTGASGWIGDGGDMIVNVAIRTLQIRGERGVLHLGSGIVIDSDPDAEYRETLAKGRGILRALNA